ncbi:RHS repeat-associated core domain-containing protein [Dissulfurirhabdus thermomarina]
MALEQGGRAYFYHLDGLGTPLALTDAEGRQAVRYDYAAFGARRRHGGRVRQALVFPGQYYDEETGLHYNWNRYYDSETGRYITPDPIGLAGGLNLYPFVYANNRPTVEVDPYGLYAGIDDLIFTAGGAVVGLAGQGIGDLIGGKLSGWEDYAGAALGGAAGGEALLYTGPVGAGAIGGAVTNLSKQGLKNVSGKQCGFDSASLAFDTGIGSLTGFIPGVRIPGITAGRGNFNSIFKQITSKFARGQISNIQQGTGIKMLVGRGVDTSLVPGAGAAAVAGAATSDFMSSENNCQCQ